MDKDMADLIVDGFREAGDAEKIRANRWVLELMGPWIFEQPISIQLEAIDMFFEKMAEVEAKIALIAREGVTNDKGR